MRRVSRLSLSEPAQKKLCDLTGKVAAAGYLAAAQRVKVRVEARKQAAKDLWKKQTTNKAFVEIQGKLAAMAPGNGLCMYCEVSMGDAIEHFWPTQRYPGRAFAWENYLWSCSICNSNFKGTQFPRDEKGAPLLINPTDEDPSDHLEFSPTTGKIEGTTLKGRETVRVLGFDRRGSLDRARQDAWNGLQELLIRYAAHCKSGDDALALTVQGLICRHPFAAALRFLLGIVDNPRGRALVHPACVAVLEGHPEVRCWP